MGEGVQGEGGGDVLAGLTGPQREAVLHTEGPLLVLAAAGSGKTRVITRRIAHLVGCGIPPWQIMALTFTNKAAGEMRQRVHTLLEGDDRRTRGLTVATFHSLCARLLRRHADAAGLKADYSIYDSADQSALIKRVIKSLDLDTSHWPPRTVLATISGAKNRLLDAAGFEADAGDFYARMIARIFKAYERALHDANAVDFDDLLLLTAKMLHEREEVRLQCQDRWRYLLIDEYQDTNHAQFRIAMLLAGDDPNICVVGDPDQSIYAWRGADISNILEFEEHYPGARVIALGENFRSSAAILRVADTLIRHNRRRKHKDLLPTRPVGEPVRVVLCRDERYEAELVVDWFKTLHGEHAPSPDPSAQFPMPSPPLPPPNAQCPVPDAPSHSALPWRDMAVFYRTNALSRVMEDELRTAGIPYVIARGTAFYEREEIRNAVAYLRVLANGADDVSLRRILNTPSRGIGATTLGRVDDFAGRAGLTLLEAMRRAGDIPGLTARAVKSIGAFVAMVDAWTGHGQFMGESVPESLADLVERVVRESGLEQMYRAQAKAGKREADAERLDNLDELVSSASQFELDYDPASDPAQFPGPDLIEGEQGEPDLLAVLRAYLESIALVSDADKVDPAQGAVMLMTLHAAKGLEFPAVAMIGLEDGLLPHARARESEADLEEERRLCFVGITRAMHRLHITSARYRTVRGVQERTIPSQFLREIGNEGVIVSDQADTLAAWDDADQRPWEERLAEARRHGKAQADSARASDKFPPGSLVKHPQFGVGQILDVVRGPNARARVQFKNVGTKTLVLRFARLERLD